MPRNTDSDWLKISQEEPYWGVLSVDDYTSGKMTPEAKAEFFRSGDAFVGHLLAVIRKHFQPDFRPARVLDFGCGVGRLTIAFAKQAGEAVGVDVAPRMLELCRENAAEANVGNLSAVPSDDELSQVQGTFDLVNSHIVLQHIEPARGLMLVERLLSRLEPGGMASLQLTYGKSRKFWPHEAPRARFYRRDGETIKDLGVNRDSRPEGTITMYDYDLNQVIALISEVARGPMLVIPTADDDHLGVQCILRRTA